jgi:hypothetical protein
MSAQINDGGPAFPLQCIGPEYPPGHVGMTLRDWFAAMASDQDIAEQLPETVGEVKKFVEERGFAPTRQWARYCHADAMIAARKGGAT